MPEHKEPDICADCGTSDSVCMHNDREVRKGFIFRRTVIQRFEGSLCVPCWKKANPELFNLKPPHRYVLVDEVLLSLRIGISITVIVLIGCLIAVGAMYQITQSYDDPVFNER